MWSVIKNLHVQVWIWLRFNMTEFAWLSLMTGSPRDMQSDVKYTEIVIHLYTDRSYSFFVLKWRVCSVISFVRCTFLPFCASPFIENQFGEEKGKAANWTLSFLTNKVCAHFLLLWLLMILRLKKTKSM